MYVCYHLEQTESCEDAPHFLVQAARMLGECSLDTCFLHRAIVFMLDPGGPWLLNWCFHFGNECLLDNILCVGGCIWNDKWRSFLKNGHCWLNIVWLEHHERRRIHQRCSWLEPSCLTIESHGSACIGGGEVVNKNYGGLILFAW